MGVEELSLSTLDGPEIEIVGNNNLAHGLRFNSGHAVLQGVAIYGFGKTSAHFQGNLLLAKGVKSGLIEKCVFGSPADLFEFPGAGAMSGNTNIMSEGADNVIIRNNMIGFSAKRGIHAHPSGNDNCFDWEIYNNEIKDNGIIEHNLDGIDIVLGSSGFHVYGNLSYGNAACGIDLWNSAGNHIIENNTLHNNGKMNVETAGLRVYGNNSTIRKNLIFDNYGAGVHVVSSAIGNTISQNSIYNNGNVFSSFTGKTMNNIGIDLIYASEDEKTGNAPFYTLNDFGDFDAGGNNALNFPVIESAVIDGNKFVLKGFARPGSVIEVFEADTFAGAIFPQGKTYLFTVEEGTNDDLDANTGSYGPTMVNNFLHGTDSTNRFHFEMPVPAGIAPNKLLTTTATLNNSTSEFSPFVVVEMKTLKVSPVLECVYPDGNGGYMAVFGYNNPNAVPVNIPAGTLNRFHPSPQDRGQDTVFAPGRNWAQFEVPFTSGNLVWILDGKTSTASPNSGQCYFDLEVKNKVSQPAPMPGDTITYCIEITNKKFRAMTGISIWGSLGATATYVSHTASEGSYDVNSGIWTVLNVDPFATETLCFTLIAEFDENFCASLVGSNQVDGNVLNNFSCVNVSTGVSSGGNDGGIESTPEMASLIAQRNYNRSKEGSIYNAMSEIPVFSKNGLKKSGASTPSIADFISEIGPNNINGLITSPSDLLTITTAIEVFSVDYVQDAERRLGSILAFTTPNGGIYEHTKPICDRLRGGTLKSISHVYINEKPFILYAIEQADGSVDYSISFVAYKSTNGQYQIDCRWNNEQYTTIGADSVYNFQVWSVSSQFTENLVQDILAEVEKLGEANYLNRFPQTIPAVFVKSGSYKNGILNLEVENSVEASEVIVSGNYGFAEDGIREDIIEYSNISSGAVQVETGYLFDIGFSMLNDKIGGNDILYFADGPWGVDFDRDGTVNRIFSAKAHDDFYLDADDYAVERGATAQGDVFDYFSVYKLMNVNLAPVDLVDYNQIEFNINASGASQIQIALAKNSVSNWSKQYRTTFTVDGTNQNVAIGFPYFTSVDGGAFDASDVTSITWSVIGNSQQAEEFEIDIEQVKFTKNFVASSNITEISKGMNVYPNPSSGSASVMLELTDASHANIELFDVLGQRVDVLFNGNLSSGTQVVGIDLSQYQNGIYFVKCNMEHKSLTQKFVISK